MCFSKKHDKSVTYAGSGLRGAYAEHTVFTFMNICKKRSVRNPNSLTRPAQNDTKKKVQSLKPLNSLHQQYIYIDMHIYSSIALYTYRPTSSKRRALLDYTSLPTTSSPFHLPPLEARPSRGHQSSRPRWPGS